MEGCTERLSRTPLQSCFNSPALFCTSVDENERAGLTSSIQNGVYLRSSCLRSALQSACSDLAAGEIRVLDITEYGGALDCALRTIRLDATKGEEYVALSYTWQQSELFGYATRRHAGASTVVKLHRLSFTNPPALPYLIQAAYHCLRSKPSRAIATTVTIWIDALCIG